MALTDDVAAILEAPTETLTVDFKERVGWDTPRGKLELARDIVCLANRQGGLLIVGVKDLGGSRFDPVGLADTESLPDVTELAQHIARFFEPMPEFKIYDLSIREKRYGVVQVAEFSQFPTICRAIGNIEGGEPVVRPGYLYRRTDEFACKPTQTAAGVAAMVQSAVAKTGAALGALLAPAPIAEPEPDPTHGLVPDVAGRYCDLTPTPEPVRQRTLAIVDRIDNAAVRSYGGMMLPRGYRVGHLEPSAIIRETERVVIDRSPDEGYGRVHSFIEVSRRLKVRIREGLWEPDGVVDYTTLFSFVFACLEFAHRFFGDADLGVTQVKVTIGLNNVIGRRLTDDPARFSGFHQSYVATSPRDLAAAKDVQVDDLADPDRCFAIGRQFIEELGEYFGFRVSDAAIDAHVEHVRQFVDVGRILPKRQADGDTSLGWPHTTIGRPHVGLASSSRPWLNGASHHRGHG